MRAKITNNSRANQGVYTDEGLVFIEPGKSRKLTIAADYVDRVKALPFLAVEGDEPDEPGPLDMNLDDLTAHIATVDDPDAAQALLDAEIAGKSRKGALAALEARRDELLAA